MNAGVHTFILTACFYTGGGVLLRYGRTMASASVVVTLEEGRIAKGARHVPAPCDKGLCLSRLCNRTELKGGRHCFGPSLTLSGLVQSQFALSFGHLRLLVVLTCLALLRVVHLAPFLFLPGTWGASKRPHKAHRV